MSWSVKCTVDIFTRISTVYVHDVTIYGKVSKNLLKQVE